jgi:hypothetical protein
MFAIGPTKTHGLDDDYLRVLTNVFAAGELTAEEHRRLLGCGVVKPADQLPVRDA